MKAGRVEIVVSSLSAHRAADKLARAGIPLFRVKKRGKNKLSFQVQGKDREKVFAILRGSCYNVEEVRFRGLAFAYGKCLERAGLLLGAAVFALSVWGMQSRVLKIDVVGSGAYLGEQVKSVLLEGGVRPFSAPPRDYSPFVAQILALPAVSHCGFRKEGGVLTVEVQVSDEGKALSSAPLVSPVRGKVEELVVLRGAPCVQVGDEVEKGQVLVEGKEVLGERERKVLVIARAKLSYPVRAEYACGEAEARAQALLDYGECDLVFERTARGYLATGVAYATAAVNLG